MPKTAIILGATGLTGSILLKKLLEDKQYNNIKLFSRKSIGFSHERIEEHLVDMLQLKTTIDDFTGDEVFCCIGTTRAKTPDKVLYHRIDYGIPIAAAQLCLQNNIKTFIVISSLGADAKSKIFYNRTKGEMENTVLALGIPKTHILQPSLIRGNRDEKRVGENFFKKLMCFINPLLIGPIKKYRSIDPEAIVSAMIYVANNSYSEQRISSDTIQDIVF